MHRPAYSSFSIDSLIGPSQPKPNPVMYSGYVLVPGATSGLGSPPGQGALSAEALRHHAAFLPGAVAMTSPTFSQPSLLTSAQTLAIQTGIQQSLRHSSLASYQNVIHHSQTRGLHPHSQTLAGMGVVSQPPRSPNPPSGSVSPKKGPDEEEQHSVDGRSDSPRDSPVELTDEGRL